MSGFRKLRWGTVWGKSFGLVLVLVLVVLVPSLCLLWFMGQAVRNERLAVRQKLTEAYRGHLALAQERLETYITQTARELDTEAEQTAPATLFERDVRVGKADALICFHDGKVTYPASGHTRAAPPTPSAWDSAAGLELAEPAAAAAAFGHLAEACTNSDLAARAFQSQARCLVRAGQREAALAVLLGPLLQPQFEHARDPQGRMVRPNAELLAFELLKTAASTNAEQVLRGLETRVANYSDDSLPSAQRRFLMHELTRLCPGAVTFPTLAAEDLAAVYLEAEPKPAVRPGLWPTAVAGVWQLASDHGRVIALHRTENLARRLQAATIPPLLPADLQLAVIPPGTEPEKPLLAAPLGTALPGWRLALSSRKPALFETAAHDRVAYYIWSCILMVGAALALGLLAMRLVRRQLALTQLRNDLVANVTHELKTPLASMRLLVDTLLDAEKLHEPTVREYLQLIARENARLSRLIDNFLAFSRMERNKRAFDFKPAWPESIIHAAADAVSERFHASGCRFEVEVPRALPPVSADADALVTAVVNLLDNAFKYSGEDKHIVLSAGSADGQVFFRVADNGIGLAPRETKRIFKRFYQVDQRMSRSGSGCGLGLSIVKFIVSAHHGTVAVASVPGQGSTFTLWIPSLDVKPETEERHESKETVDCGR